MKGLYTTKSRAQVRRASVPQFIGRMAEQHPELRDVVGFEEMTRMANRDGVTVRVVDFPACQKGRLVRLWGHPFIMINRSSSRAEQAMDGMHELCHFWRDDPGVASYYSDGETGGPNDEFADIFAWTVTSPARIYMEAAHDNAAAVRDALKVLRTSPNVSRSNLP